MPEDIVPISIEDEMKTSYINFAMSVIIRRALPSVQDGLKPVHRRILYSMKDLGLEHNKPHRKAARLVGEVIGKYHPHGDAAVYDTIVRMAQDFSMRYPLVDGHGNFGSIDGDEPAAMRYTEVRMSPIAEEMLADIDKDTVDFMPNFDESLEEPVVLPSKYPNLLVNGSSGIAVGMATNIPPHNLAEVINGLILLIDNPEASIKELMMMIRGPDFPTGGMIMGREGIKSAYETGRGKIIVRARAFIERVSKKGRDRIIVTELPYQVNKSSLIEKIADLVNSRKIEGISDLRDESDRNGMRIAIDLKREAIPKVVLNQLYKHTFMQTTFGVINLALVDGRPVVLNLKSLLSHYLEHRKVVVIRRTNYELRKAEARAHILEGLMIALDNLDKVIKLIRSSQDANQAREGLMSKFKLSEKQAQAILDMRLHRLTGLERKSIEKEYKEVLADVSSLKDLLASEKKIMNLIKEELLEIKKKYGDERRAEIRASEEEFDIEDLIADEDEVVTITRDGYIKRLPLRTYKRQLRGGRGVTGMGTKEEDFVEHLFVTSTHDYMLFFTNKGRVYQLKVFELTTGSRRSKGTSIVNLLQINKEERISAIISVKDFDKDSYFIMVTRKGIIKKVKFSAYSSKRSNGLIALTLDEGDELIDVKETDGKREVLLGTKKGQLSRFSEDCVRDMGRSARGVKGINLNEDDEVIGMEIVQQNGQLLTVATKGYGKRTPLDEYSSHNRGGKGIKAIHLTEKNGEVISIKVVNDSDELILITAQGMVIRLKVKNIHTTGRYSQGVILQRLDEGDSIVAVETIAKDRVQEAFIDSV